jgi:hypothetical protein
MATTQSVIEIEEKGQDLSQKTICLKIHLGLLGNSRKVSNSQVEVDADKALIRVSKNLLDSKELQAIKTLDGEIRQFLYNMCLPFETAIHLLPLPLIETVDQKLREFEQMRRDRIEVFIEAYPGLCREAAIRLRALYNPLDYPPLDVIRSRFTFSWQYVSFGVPGQLREISARIFQTEREKAAQMMSEAASEIQQVLRATLAEMVEHLRGRLSDDPDGKPRRLRETTVTKLRDFLDSFDFRNVLDDRELKEQVEKARQLLSGVTTDALRNTADLRAKLKQGMGEIASRLDGMIVEGPRRKFRFEED